MSSIVHIGLLHLSFDVELGLELYLYPLSYIYLVAAGSKVFKDFCFLLILSFNALLVKVVNRVLKCSKSGQK